MNDNHQQQLKLIKRPARVIPHKRQRQNVKIRKKVADISNITLTPIIRRSNMRSNSEKQKSAKQIETTSLKRVQKSIRRTSVPSESGPEVFTKTLNKVRRKKWVPLNAKQKEYISDVMNSAVSFATSTLTNSSEEISSLDTFLHAVKIKLVQHLSQIIVPPLRYSAIVEVDKLVNFSNIIQELDDRIETLIKAVDEQNALVLEKRQKLKHLDISSTSFQL